MYNLVKVQDNSNKKVLNIELGELEQKDKIGLFVNGEKEMELFINTREKVELYVGDKEYKGDVRNITLKISENLIKEYEEYSVGFKKKGFFNIFVMLKTYINRNFII